jgi:hypothetical protein
MTSKSALKLSLHIDTRALLHTLLILLPHLDVRGCCQVYPLPITSYKHTPADDMLLRRLLLRSIARQASPIKGISCNSRVLALGSTLSPSQHLIYTPIPTCSTGRALSYTAVSKAEAASNPSTSTSKQSGKIRNTSETPHFARRSMLYVPGSSDKMIKKSQESPADCLIFDLEDSVATHRKGAARESVYNGINAAPRRGPELAVRINPPSGSKSLAKDDLDVILPSRQLNVSIVSLLYLCSLPSSVEIISLLQYTHRHWYSPKSNRSKISSLSWKGFNIIVLQPTSPFLCSPLCSRSKVLAHSYRWRAL